MSTPSPLPAWSAPPRTGSDSDMPLRTSAVISALSHALDLSTGQPIGHSIRACVLGMRIAGEIGMPEAMRDDLYYALLLKDCGCSVNASKMFHALGADELRAKRDVKTTDWTRLSRETVEYALSHVGTGKPCWERSRVLFRLAVNQKRHARDVTRMRCERGATLARLMGLSAATADAILSLDEHWNGQGEPEGLRKEEIPVFSRIMLLAQTLEVYMAKYGEQTAVETVRARSGRWFDPELVKGAISLHARGGLWRGVAGDEVFELVLRLETRQRSLGAGETTLEAICLAFAQIVDAKSPFTFNHSNGVANAAVAIAQMMQLSGERTAFIRHAALLHDLGKLGVSNAILEKPGKLDEEEMRSMRLHAFYTWKILNGIPGFGEMSEVAASHHEKLDGTGYFRGLTARDLPLESRILAVADIFDALSARRPYRDGLPPGEVFSIMRGDTPHAIDADCVDALQSSGVESNQAFVDLQMLRNQLNAF